MRVRNEIKRKVKYGEEHVLFSIMSMLAFTISFHTAFICELEFEKRAKISPG